MTTSAQSISRRGSRGFTLIELLVVIAISVILFTLLLRPLVESLGLTARAQTLSAGQDAARKTMEILSRDLANAVYVFDNQSHPFQIPAGYVPTPTDDRYTNFLDLQVINQAGNPVIEHAYDAKLDIVPARHAESAGNLTDPTTTEPIEAVNGQLGSTSLMFPLAPDTIIIRYFIGLQHPVGLNGTVLNYGDPIDYKSSANTNTYVLYRVAVPVNTTFHNPDGSLKQNKDGTTINELLFAPQHDPMSGRVINRPELDDPDFFRIVSTTDINWLDKAHANYAGIDVTGTNDDPTTGPIGHNTRVENWAKLAKPVITAPDIDLIALPHNPDGTINFNNITFPAAFAGDPCSAVAHDPVLNQQFPVVDTTVTFRPASQTADAAPGTTTDYGQVGIPTDAADNGGVPYIPTYFTASDQSWSYPYRISLYNVFTYTDPNASTTPFYATGIFSGAPVTVANMYADPGDLMEYVEPNLMVTNANAGTAAFDISTGTVMQGADSNNYIPMSVNPDKGTIDFDTPALPMPANMNSQMTGGYNGYVRFWTADPALINNGGLQAAMLDSNNDPVPGMIDLTKLFVDDTQSTGLLLPTTGAAGFNTSPLPRPDNAASGLQCLFAHPVPGSFRVYGPDALPGPNNGHSVLYTEISPGEPLGPDKYVVDYVNDTIQFDVTSGTTGDQLPVPAPLPGDPYTAGSASALPPDWVKIAFNYQSNLRPSATGSAVSSGNPAGPMAVKVDYLTRDLLDVNIGVRVFDGTTGQVFLIPASSQIRVGNSNH